MENNFQWDDKKVMEFVSFTLDKSSAFQGRYTDMEEFKASKQSDEREWEIAGYYSPKTKEVFNRKGDKGMWYHDKSEAYIVMPLHHSGIEIHSVKRLSDSEIFTIGDKVTYNNLDEAYKITGFTERDPVMTADHSMGYINIMFAQKSKPVIFRTHDGKDVAEGDEYWYVTSWTITKLRAVADWEKSLADTAFSNEGKALEYVRLHKPVLSNEEAWHCLVDFICESEKPRAKDSLALFVQFKMQLP